MEVITIIKRMALACIITLVSDMQFCVTQTKTICNSPQYIELGKNGIVTCRFHKEFFAVWWYSSVDFKNSLATIEYQNKNKSGPGFESGEFDVHPNGSLIVTEVKLEHEDAFTVAYLPSKEEFYGFIQIQVVVIVLRTQRLMSQSSSLGEFFVKNIYALKNYAGLNFYGKLKQFRIKSFHYAIKLVTESLGVSVMLLQTVKPDVPFPLISQCGNVSNTCFIVAGKDGLECVVHGARPAVSLNFISRTVDGDRNISEEFIITPEGHGYTSRVSTRNALLVSPLLVLLVCKASSIPRLFDNTESIVLVQNRLLDRISEQLTPITIQRYERMELHCTENGNALTVWKKAIPPSYMDYELLLYSVSLGQEVFEVFAKDVILEHNNLLVIPSIEIKHEGEYLCIYGNGLSDGIRAYNVTVAVLAYPVIDGCNDQTFCEIQGEYGGRLSCSVEGIRPQVELQWKAYFENQSDLISFYNPQPKVKDNGGLFDVTLIVQYRVSEKLRGRLTLECGVVSADDLLSNVAKKMDLIFLTGTPPTTGPSNRRAPNSLPVWFLVMIILLLLLIGGVTIVIFCRRKLQSNTGTGDVEVEVTLLEVPFVGKKDQFLKELKETYKDLYDEVKPVPYIKDKMRCVNNVFVDRCITFKDSGGEWIGLKTYHHVFSDSRIRSKRLFLEGDHGYGKSTVSLQYAYDWCNSVQCSPLKDVDILLLLRLRQLGGVSSIYRAIKQFLLPKDSLMTESDIKDILLNSNSVVIIFDGYDEYPDQDNTTSDVIKIIARQMFQDVIVVLTTRSSCIPQKYSPSTEKLKLTGFSNNARKDYIKKAVVDNEETVNEIEAYLEKNPILSDLCQIPLLFVLFAHMMHENEQLRNSESATMFFRHSISCLLHHMKNKAKDDNACNYDLTEYKHSDLNIVAFNALNEKSKGMVWKKEELCKEVGQIYYDLYKEMGILVEEEVLHFNDEPLNSDHVRYITEVRFYHKIFCEWYAAHYLSYYIQENPTLDLEECLRNLHPVDVQYLYRFLCGLSSDCAEKIIHYLAEKEGGDKFAILCILEKTGNIDNIKETIRQLCSEGVMISAHDSLLLQRSSLQLLAISARNEISVKLLQLHNCFKSVDFSKPALNTTSDLVLSSKIPVEQLGLRLFNKRTSDNEYTDILKFSSMCPSLRLLGIYGSPPPKCLMLEPTLSKLSSGNVKVKYYGPFLESPVYTLNLLSGQWERICDGAQCTDEDFEQMELDWERVGDRDVNEFRRVIRGYRKQLREASTTSTVVHEEKDMENGEDGQDIMALLRIHRDRE